METKIKFKFKKVVLAYFTITFVLVIFCFGLFLGYKIKPDTNTGGEGKVLNTGSTSENISQDVDFNLFWQVWDTVKKKYVNQPVSDKKLFYGAMAGLLSGLDDPYSVFFEPETSKKFTQEISGVFEGIGAEIAIKNNTLTIVAPLPSTPAEKAGLKSGDKIVAINDIDTTGIALDQAVNLIKGKKGTAANLTIMRSGWDKPQKFSVTRDVISIPSVRWNESEKNKGIFVINVSYLNEDTDTVFQKAVTDILEKKPKAIILDLRNDPGGLLDVAIKIASYWVDKGVVVSEQFGSGYTDILNLDRKVEYESKGYAKLKDIPTVVLVNQGSASGSEIIAGALQDYGIAPLVGEKTFGKGSVQELENLPDGSSVKLTIAEWFTPKGKNINKEGIKPDFEVKLTDEDYNKDKDPQMDKAIEILNSKIK